MEQLHLRFHKKGASLVELLLAIALAGLVIPAIISGFITSRQGKVQQESRVDATLSLREAIEAVRSVRERGWTAFAVDGTYYPAVSSGQWVLTSGTQITNGLTRKIVISSVNRDTNGKIVTSGGSNDPSTKKVDITVSWTQPYSSQVTSSLYITRYLGNMSSIQTTQADFNGDTLTQASVTNTSGGEVQLGNNNKAKWCSPSYSSATIDLPDGPPVAVAATASATSVSTPNDVYVAVAPYATSSAKLAYINVTANQDPPVASLKGIFTLDAAQYSAPGLVPTGINLDNSFSTNAVAYYTAPSGNRYALLGTTKPDHEVIAVQITNAGADYYQDATNKIYKYKTFFNTRMYQGNTTSTPNQDQSPYGYGVVSLKVLGNRAYALSGGFLYIIDLSTIDSKSATVGLDMVGCRIEIDGYDCNVTTSKTTKYGAGSTGSSFQTESAGQTGCSDGGAIQKYADNDVFPIQVGSNTYVYIAVGAGTDPELDIVNVTSVPTSSTSPKISASTCGTIASGNSGWKRISSLDFNSKSGTQESSNSVFGKSDGTRAYIASNGGVDGNGDGLPDSDQFYVVDTTNKSAPKFLTGSSSTGATSGYYNGNTTNIQMFPRRSLTVLNGQRVVIVGQDGVADATEPQEYQVLNIDSESTPTYCGGLNFISGFNDLTSVTEADFDNFVYMVANTQEKQLKIVQGGPDGTYVDTATLVSSPIDAGYRTAFNSYAATFSQPTNTSIKFQFAGADPVNGSCTNANYVFLGPDGTDTSYYTATSGALLVNNDGSGYENPAQCFRYKAFFSTTDYNATAVLNDMTINYSP